MLEYKLKNNCININSKEPIVDYLKSLGISKVDSFINEPDEKDELNPFFLENMEKCIIELNKGFESNKKFFIQVDSDADGITSAAIFYRFFKSIYPNANIVWRMHDGKEHGVILDTIPVDADYVILPDSGSMQIREQQAIVELNKKVIILDHHNVSEICNEDGIILVNNQISLNFNNRHLSGAGVVFKMIQAYSTEYLLDVGVASEYYDLAALGIISDMMDSRNLDNNYIIYQGLHEINNKMFKSLLEQQAYSIKNITAPSKIDIAFYVTPLINSVIRVGTAEEKDLLFRGFIEEPTQDIIETECKGKIRQESFYEYVARTASNVRNKQNTLKEKCFEFLKEKIKKENLDDNKIISVVVSDEDKVLVPQNITGLIAMELLKYYKKPCLVLRSKIENNELTYSGSGRGNRYDGFSSFRQLVKDSDASEYAEGHDMAFGASIKSEEYSSFIKETNEKLKEVNFGSDYIEVDAIFNCLNINYNMLYEFAKYSNIYGNSIPQTRIAIEGKLHSNSVTVMGKDQSSVKISIGDISCVKFKDKKLVDELSSNAFVEFKLIGKSQINEWMGRENIQVIIEAIEITPVNITNLF